jgi:uncharacterized repeat protein (TIGR03803 family)
MEVNRSSPPLNAMLAVLTIALTFAPGAQAGTKFKVLYSFRGGSDGAALYGNVTLDPMGNLYGATGGGGTYNTGTVYKLKRGGNGSWTKSKLYDLNYKTDGGDPTSGLVLNGSGNLYGTTTYGGAGEVGTVLQLSQSAQGDWSLTVLNGVGSPAGLATDSGGNLYGYGGPGKYGGGNVYELFSSSAGWQYRELYSFGGHQGDGNSFLSAPALDASGNLLGTTEWGGNGYPKCPGGAGCGIAFKLTPSSSG